MAQAGRAEGKSQAQRARAWAIGLSLAAHAIALAILAWTTPILRLPVADWRPDITIDLSRPPPLARPQVQQAVTAPHASAAPAPAPSPIIQPQRPRPAPAPPRPVLIPTPARPLPPIPAAPSPVAPTPAPSSAARPGPAAPQSRTGDQGLGGGDVRGAVRAAIGCNHETYLQLSPAEREACERKLAEGPPHSGSYVDPIPPLKRGAFDRQAAADARRRDHEGPMRNPIVPCPGGSGGSNFGIGCLPPEAMHSTRFGPTPRGPAPDPEP